MAKGNRRKTGEPDELVPEFGTEQTDKDSGTKSSGKGSGSGSGSGSGTDTAGTTKKEIVSGLASVEETIPEPKKPEPKKVTRKRTNKNNKKNDSAFNAEQITNLLTGLSAIAGQSEAGKFFAITETEAKQIAEPLANIIAKNDAFAQLGEHSDAIALTSACFMIFVPRLIAFLMHQKQMKLLKKQNVMVVKKEADQNGSKGSNSGSDAEASGSNAGAIPPNDKGILSGLPSLA